MGKVQRKSEPPLMCPRIRRLLKSAVAGLVSLMRQYSYELAQLKRGDLNSVSERINVMEIRSVPACDDLDDAAPPVLSEVLAGGNRSSVSFVPSSAVKDAGMVALCNDI